MWRRRGSGLGGRRRGVGYSYATVVLLISAAILLFVYLTGRLDF